MKKQIKLCIVAICCIFTTINTNAQKQKMVRLGTNVGTIATQPGKGINVGDLVTQGPKQDPNLASAIGWIKIEGDTTLILDQNSEYGKYTMYLNKVVKNEAKQSDAGGLVPNKYILGQNLGEMGAPNMRIVLTKLSNKDYTYEIFNLPLKTQFVIQFSTPSGKHREDATPTIQKLCNGVLINAYCPSDLETKAFKPINDEPTRKGQTILPTIYIKNQTQVN
jgi:hypothetical protein